MSIQTQIDRIKGNVTRSLAKVAEKGVTVPEGAGSDDLAGLIDAITGGAGGGSGSALPTGISAIACGSFTQASDTTTQFTINHDLGVVPNFYIISAVGTIDGASILLAQIYVKVEHIDADDIKYYGRHMLMSLNGSGSTVVTYNSKITSETQFANESTVKVVGSSTRTLPAGVTYNWIVGVIDRLN